MSKKEQTNIEKDTKVFNILLVFICAILFGFGIYQISTNRLEDGLINLVISTGLGSIPFSTPGFNYNKSPFWVKAIFTVLAIFVVISTVYLVYLGFTRKN